MSRVAKRPIAIPEHVHLSVEGSTITAQGAQGSANLVMHPTVRCEHHDRHLIFSAKQESAWIMAGTMRALAANLIHGVHVGFEKKLVLNGVGYRAQIKNNTLALQLGFSHPIEYPLPPEVSIELPSQTEIVVRGINKQKVGHVAAELRAYRPPEPYKGKGIRYDDEIILRKEGKKKASS